MAEEEKPLDVKLTIPERIRDIDILQLRRIPAKVPAIDGRTSTPEELAACIAQIKQVIETREGTRGSWVEKAVLWRDLIGSGLARVQVDGSIYSPGGGTGGGGTGGGVLPPLNPVEVPNYTPPPAPTGVAASGSMTGIMVTWNAPGYDYHGHAEVWRAESNLIGNAVLIGTSTSTIYVDEVGAAVSRYYWVRFKSKWDVLGPYNGTDGTLATTGADIPYLLEQLEGQITQTQLDATLSAEIDQIDVLAIEVSALSAGVSGAFDPFFTYYFDTSAEGWVTDTDSTVTHSAGHLIVNSTGTTPSVKLTSDLNPSVTGANYPVVKARIKRVSGSTWSGKLQWKTSGHAFSASYQKVISDPTVAIGDYATIEWDMSADADYTGGSILNLRLEIGAATDDDFDIDWVAVGRNAPGASVAMVGAETAARVSADDAEITARELLAVKVIGTADPDDIDGIADLASGLIYEEKILRVADNAARASDIQTLETTVDGNTAAIEVNATSINGLEAQYTVKIDVNGYVSGYGLAVNDPDGEPGGQISTFGVRADTFYIANPTGPGVPPVMPFVVKTTNWVSDGGITNPPGVYITSARIADGQITNAKIGNLAVDNAKIANLDAAKITSGEIVADRLNANTITGKVLSVEMAKLVTGIVGGNIYSQSYAWGSGGWALYQNGTADLNNAIIRGQINGGAFTGYAWPSAGNYGFHLGPNGLLLGNANNNKYFQVTYDGNVYAPGFSIVNGTATFSGALSAATGTFSGYLASTTGYFGGSITGTAVIGTAQIGLAQVDRLRIQNNAVIIPAANFYSGTWQGTSNWLNAVSVSIQLFEYTNLYIIASAGLTYIDTGNPAGKYAFRLLVNGGGPILWGGPGYYGSPFDLQTMDGSMSLSRSWAENAGTHTFTLQFNAPGDVYCMYPSIIVLCMRTTGA